MRINEFIILHDAETGNPILVKSFSIETATVVRLNGNVTSVCMERFPASREPLVLSVSETVDEIMELITEDYCVVSYNKATIILEELCEILSAEPAGSVTISVDDVKAIGKRYGIEL